MPSLDFVDDRTGVLKPMSFRRFQLGQGGAARSRNQEPRYQFGRDEDILEAGAEVSLRLLEAKIRAGLAGEDAVFS